MDLSLDSTQQLIQESARDFVRGACAREVLVKLDRDPAGIREDLWSRMSGRWNCDSTSDPLRCRTM